MQSASQKAGYVVQRTDILPPISAPWEDASWSPAETLAVSRFHPRSSSHQPRTEARLLHNGDAIAIIFRVEDRYVLARHTSYQSPTHQDSCVEFFVQPQPTSGYFNFEFNAIGTLLLWYIDRPRRPDGSFEHSVEVPLELARGIIVQASLTAPLHDEVASHIVWTLSFRVQKSLFESFVGPLRDLSGETWRANFYKCADLSSHPHWSAWAEIGDRLDFHQPESFGELVFA
jgi:hypothetical protein